MINLLYGGNSKIFDGVLISLLSAVKKTKETKKIFAGSIDAADLIIDLYNQHSDKVYEHKRFGFKKKVITSYPIEVLEAQQKDTAEQELLNRIEKEKRESNNEN